MMQMDIYDLLDEGINVLSLFNGISVGYESLLAADIKVENYYSSEIEEAPIIITKSNHPEIIEIGDVTKWREWDLPKIDLLIGGSPCQGFSRQGVGLNFEDPRSKLFFEFVDILEYLKTKNPKLIFMLENVDMKKEWEDIITERLGVKPVHINSDLFLPHNRPRTYWTNVVIEIPKKKEYSLLNLLEDVTLEEYVEMSGIKICKSFSEKSIKLIVIKNGEVRVSQSTKKGYAVAEPGDGINISFPTSKTRRGRVIKGRSSCLDTSCDIGVYDNKRQVRRFTITELESLQGLPKGYTSYVDENSAKKALGNGWTKDVITYIFKQIKKELQK